MSEPPGQGARAIPSLTGIRGVAALWVFSYHITGFAGLLLPGHRLLQSSLFANGFRGVDLFFLLSGFILMHVHWPDFATLSWPAVRRFLVIRFFRVYPLNTVILLLLLPLALFAPAYVAQSRAFTDPHFSYKIHNLSAAGFVQSLCLVQTWSVAKLGEWNGPSWTLSAEVLGYMLFPFLAVGAMRRRAGTCIALAAASLLLMLGAMIAGHHFTTNTNPSGTFGTVRMLGSFTAGVLLQRAHHLLGARAKPWASALTIGGLGLLAVSLLNRYLPILDCFAFALLIFGLASQSGPVDRLLRTAPALWLGRISFSFYLFHEVLISLFQWRLLPLLGGASAGVRLLALGGLILACFGAAWVLYELVERPSQRLGREMARRAGQLGAAPVAGPLPS